MMFQVTFSAAASKEIEALKRTGNKQIIQKISSLIKEIAETPFSGTGKPEQLKHSLSGYWSQRLNKEHRLVYRVDEATVTILSVKGHYEP